MPPQAAPTDPIGRDSPLLEEGYQPLASGHDELSPGPGEFRPVWKPTLEALNALGPAERQRRAADSERLIRDFGVSYNVYSRAEADQGWEMDMVPFVLGATEWEFLETALSQRLHLLNLVLGDAYGEQSLLTGHRLPPSLVLGNPSFLPAAHRLIPAKHRHIQFYAADLARSTKGSWWVLSDRLDAPSGLGYALENRSLSHRLFPEGLRAQTVHSLQPFISAYSETIAALAPRDIDDPHVVLLTPGPHNETYFEHSYLARTLGFPLVEGDDLTVRDGRVFLKSISGLRQVDVIVRRLDSDWCDPLELRGDSLLGIPGLLQAIRSGQVAVANAVGSGLAQSPAITAFLQSLSQQLLGEDLKIPSVATWWCGQERERRYVLDNLASLVIKPAKKPGTHPAILASQLSAAELDTWRRRIERTPDDWCAQEFVDRATTPALRDGRLEPSRFLLRVFMVRSGGRYRLLPGGMARVSGAPGFSMSMQYGAVSKDVWVVGESAAVQRSSGPPVRQGAHLLRRSTHSLPSRTADNLFWLGRYLERVEFKARVARTLVDALMDEAAFSAADSIAPVFGVLCPGCDLKSLRRRNALNLSACENLLDQWFNGVLPFGGLRADVESAVRIARSVKERLSLETWNSLAAAAQSEGALSQNPGVVISDHTVKSLDRTITLLSSISGLFMENMTRGDGWLFQDLGRRIERGAQLCRLLSTAIVPPARDEESMLRLLLRCADSLITYRRRYFTQIYSLAVLDLLLFDACNPRSMAFQIGEISSHLDGLPHRQQPKAAPLPMDQTALRLVSQIGLDEAKHLDGQVRGRRKDLAKFLEELAGHFGTLSAQIGDHYFAITRSQPSAARDPFADRF